MRTRNILVPVDGSPNSLRALKHALERHGTSPRAHFLLLNVQPALPSSRHVPASMIKDHQQRMAEEALAPAREIAERSGASFDCYMRVGDPAETIASVAQRTRCGDIVMGSRGLGRVRSLVLGSVTTKLIQLATVPVTLVK